MESEFGSGGTAIVTGGARRIGAALCRALAADGWHVLIHCHDSVGDAEALAAEIGKASVVAADLSDDHAPALIFDMLEGLPPLRILVNNASMFSFDSAADFTAQSWDEHHRINLRAPALLCRAFAAAVAGRGGLIVNLLDAKLAQPNADFFSYTASKMGLAGLTELFARAYGPQGIRVCGIAPAITLRSGLQSQDNFEMVHRLNLLERGVKVDDIVRALRFVVETPTLTGETIVVDGGQRFLGLARDVQLLGQQG